MMADQNGTKHGVERGMNQRIESEGLEPEWELFDLENDPFEMHNLIDDTAYAGVIRELKDELHRLQSELGDERYYKDV